MARLDWSRFDWSSLRQGWLEDLRVATVFFTALPVRVEGEISGEAIGHALRCWPIVGAAVGIGGAVAYLFAMVLGLAALPSALIALSATIALTGALHEDGLADLADSLGGSDRERRLAIMRDSRIGAFGVLALIMSVILRASLLAQLATPRTAAVSLVAAAAASRGLVPTITLMLAPARREGLGAMLGELRSEVIAAAAALAVLAALLLLGIGAGIAALALAFAAIIGVASLARSRLGGYTGDVLGAAQQAAEAAVLGAAAMFM